jgi:hypothetical protein
LKVVFINAIQCEQEFQALHFNQEVDSFCFSIVSQMEGRNDVDHFQQIFKGIISIGVGTIDDSLIVFLSNFPS